MIMEPAAFQTAGSLIMASIARAKRGGDYGNETMHANPPGGEGCHSTPVGAGSPKRELWKEMI